MASLELSHSWDARMMTRMPRRKTDSLYTGALGLVSATDIALLSGSVLQPKKDGVYAVITTDSTGAIGRILLRNGQEIDQSIAVEFRGVRWAPTSALVCELEAYTEASDRLREARGYRVAHVFDALRLNGADVSSLPQRSRRDALMRTWAMLEDDRSWTDDAQGRAHSKRSGRFAGRIPNGHRRLPIVPQLPVSAYDRAMAEWVGTGEAEGLVAVAELAPIGKRGAKLKHKTAEYLDCVIVDRDKSAAILAWKAGWFTTSCQGQKWAHLKRGDVVEVKHNGWCERKVEPRFPRLHRQRLDLSAEAVCPLWAVHPMVALDVERQALS